MRYCEASTFEGHKIIPICYF